MNFAVDCFQKISCQKLFMPFLILVNKRGTHICIALVVREVCALSTISTLEPYASRILARMACVSAALHGDHGLQQIE